ncbi:MAG: tRNA lysidine(34) synthetase TilS [Desulfonatronovibrionaceae bacterium]
MSYSKLQELPPLWARFCLRHQDFMEMLTRQSMQDKKVVLALSGGADSMALLRILHFLIPRTGLKLTAVHLNHMLRDNAQNDEKLAREQCLKLGIDFRAGHSRVASYARLTRTGTEEAARILRYRFLFMEAARRNADYVVTGHNLNDLAEDVLMRLGRGAGWPGLAGMAGYDPGRKLLRPLLLTSREKITDFLENLGQVWSRDESNLDVSFSRNRVRHELVPLMKSIYPGFFRSVANLWKLGRMDEAYWAEVLEHSADKALTGKDYYDHQTLSAMNQAARLRLYKQVLDRKGPGHVLFENLTELDRLWMQGRGGKVIRFPGRKFARIVQRGILFGCDDQRG